jgi:hypothetical protein
MQITRNDVLRRDLRSVGLKPGSSGCTVLTGALQACRRRLPAPIYGST